MGDRLRDKVAVITGAASGVDAAAARLFATGLPAGIRALRFS